MHINRYNNILSYFCQKVKNLNETIINFLLIINKTTDFSVSFVYTIQLVILTPTNLCSSDRPHSRCQHIHCRYSPDHRRYHIPSRCFHVSLICDVSPNCDCHPENDIPNLPNIGMLASFDPVALDQACADLCNQATPVESSVLGKNIAHAHEHHEECDHDHFHMTHPDTEWKSCIEHAVKIGLGTNEYDLETI